MFGDWGNSLSKILANYGDAGSALDSNPLMSGAPTFAANKALDYTAAPQQPTQSQKPMGFLAPYANKIPGMQGLGNMMSKDNYLLPKILAGVGGAMQFKNPMLKINPMIGDLLAGQSINKMGSGQAQQPQQPQPQQVAQTPTPNPTARQVETPAATAPVAKRVPPLMGGVGPQDNGPFYTKQEPAPFVQPEKPFFMKSEQPSFSNSPQVSGGTEGSPDTATAPSFQQPPAGDTGVGPDVMGMLGEARGYTRPTIDPWTSFMLTGVRPGTSPQTGYTAGNEFLRMSLDEADKRAKRGTELMNQYNTAYGNLNKPLLQHWQAMEHQANFAKIMGDPRTIKAVGDMEFAKKSGEADAKRVAARALASDPNINSIPVSPALQELGITSMGQVAALAEVGSISALDNLIKMMGNIESAYINAKSRVLSANISAGAHAQATQHQTNQIIAMTHKTLLDDAQRGIKQINAMYYDPEAVAALPANQQELKTYMMKDKLPLTPQAKAQLEGYVATGTMARNALTHLGQVSGQLPATQQGQAAQPPAGPAAQAGAPPLSKTSPTAASPAGRRRVAPVIGQKYQPNGTETVNGVATDVYSPDGGKTIYLPDGRKVVNGRVQ